MEVWWKHVCTCVEGGCMFLGSLCCGSSHLCKLLCECQKCHEFCFWHLSATAGASGCTFAVVSESEKPFVEKVLRVVCVVVFQRVPRGGGGGLGAFTVLQSLISISAPLEAREVISQAYPEKWMCA